MRPALPVSSPTAFPGASDPLGLPVLPCSPLPDPVHLSVCGRGQAGGCLGRGDVKLRTGEPDRKVTGAFLVSRADPGCGPGGAAGRTGLGSGRTSRVPELFEVGASFPESHGIVKKWGTWRDFRVAGSRWADTELFLVGRGRGGWVTLNSGERQAGRAEDLISQDALGSAPRNFLLEVP